MLNADGNIYGTTTFGGESNQGVFFEVVGPGDTGRYKEKVEIISAALIVPSAKIEHLPARTPLPSWTKILEDTETQKRYARYRYF